MKWIQVFRGKQRRKDQERWACTGCGAIHDASHNDTPPNGACHCAECRGHLSNTELYRNNYDLINWHKDTGTDEPRKPAITNGIASIDIPNLINLDDYLNNLHQINEEIGAEMGLTHAT